MANSMLDFALAYADAGLAVFPLRPHDKRPATANGFKDATRDPSTIERWWARTPDANIGVACGKASGGLVVLDFDVDDGKDGLDALHDWERGHGELPETVSAETGRGGMHLYYRAENIRNSANGTLGVDVRGEGGYVVAPPSLHPNGSAYAWMNDPEEYGIADADERVLAFIEHVAGRRSSTKTAKQWQADEVAKGGRNDSLYKYVCSLLAKSVNREFLRPLAIAYNAEHCKPPLPLDEVEKTLQSALTRPDGHSDEVKAQVEKSTSGHVKIAEKLIDEYGACFIDGMPAVRDGGVYSTGWQAVNAAMVKVKKNIKSAQRREVREYLSIAAPHKAQSRYTLVGFKNGVFDLATSEFRSYRDDDVICNVIPHNWNPDAQAPQVDAMLERVSCGNEANRMNIEEAIALCALRTSRFSVCPVFIGDGANGKSTVLAMMRQFLGNDNISALQPREINKRFQPVQLVGKTANLGDDISSEFLTADECSGIKKVATGDYIYTDVKGADGIRFSPYATMVFSANEFPRLGDSTPGMYRRLHPIEFNARFTREDPDYNPNIIDTLMSEEAMERVCCIAMLAASRLIDQRGMTPNPASERILDAIREDNNSVLMWTRMTGISEEGVVGRVASDVYRDYRNWCIDWNVKQLGVKKFNKALRALWNVAPGSIGHVSEHGRRKTVRYFEKVS